MITTSVPGGGLPMAWRGVPGTRDIEIAPSLEPYPSTMGQPKRRLNVEMSWGEASVPKPNRKVFSASSGRGAVAST